MTFWTLGAVFLEHVRLIELFGKRGLFTKDLQRFRKQIGIF